MSEKTTWKEFLCRHREVMVAAHFFTIEAWTRKGLTRFLALFFIDLSSRRVEIAGIASQANGLWMSQVARNLCDAADGFLTRKRYLIHDRDPLFTAEFQEILKGAEIHSVKLPPVRVIPGQGAQAGLVHLPPSPLRALTLSERLAFLIRTDRAKSLRVVDASARLRLHLQEYFDSDQAVREKQRA